MRVSPLTCGICTNSRLVLELNWILDTQMVPENQRIGVRNHTTCLEENY